MRWSLRSGVALSLLWLFGACHHPSRPKESTSGDTTWAPGEWTIASASVFEPGIDPPLYGVGDSITFALDRMVAERRHGMRQDLSREAIEERFGFPLDEYQNQGSAAYVFYRFVVDRRDAPEGTRTSYMLTVHQNDWGIPPLAEEECEIDDRGGPLLSWHAIYNLRRGSGQ